MKDVWQKVVGTFTRKEARHMISKRDFPALLGGSIGKVQTRVDIWSIQGRRCCALQSPGNLCCLTPPIRGFNDSLETPSLMAVLQAGGPSDGDDICLLSGPPAEPVAIDTPHLTSSLHLITLPHLSHSTLHPLSPPVILLFSCSHHLILLLLTPLLPLL